MKEQLTKYITVGITDQDKCGIKVSPNLEASEAFRLIGTLTLHLLNAYTDVATAQLKTSNLKSKEKDAAITGIKESMYDAVDSIFSNVLAQFYPDAPNLSLEDEAILELTNKKIEERYNALSEKEKAAYSRQYNVIKTKMQLTPHDNSSRSES